MKAYQKREKNNAQQSERIFVLSSWQNLAPKKQV
jgi:hypothetical protein